MYVKLNAFYVFREFQKHEVLNIEKVEQSLHKIQKDAKQTGSPLDLLEKENLGSRILECEKTITTINNPSDDMEITGFVDEATNFVCKTNNDAPLSNNWLKGVDACSERSSHVKIISAVPKAQGILQINVIFCQ